MYQHIERTLRLLLCLTATQLLPGCLNEEVPVDIPCDPGCDAPTSVCDRLRGECTACVVDADCAIDESPTPYCEGRAACVACRDSSDCPTGISCAGGICGECSSLADCPPTARYCVANECLECQTSADCTNATAARCESEMCVPCQADTDCTGVTGAPRCNTTSGRCVGCDPSTEASDCSGNSCNPATLQCTTNALGQTDACGACLSDTECGPDMRCVPMTFEGNALPGGFCLRQASAGCLNPLRTLTPMRSSLSGVAPEQYCGLNEAATSCAAVNALADDCSSGACPAGGRCEDILGAGHVCTISCASAFSCPTEGPVNGCDNVAGHCGTPAP